MADQPTKTLAEYFADWEGHAFGFGYGTGEKFIIPAIQRFLNLCPKEGAYDHAAIEAELGGVVAWLLINRFCDYSVDILDYGVSPRFAWLTDEGQRLRAFVLAHSADELMEMLRRDSDYSECYPDACNCGPNGYEEGRICQNPFWPHK